MPTGALRTIEGVNVTGKRVLVRIDADVDLDASGQMEAGGDHRLRGCLPTLQLLLRGYARVILLTHLGRPHGRVVETLRVAPIAELLEGDLRVPIRTLRVTTGPEALEAALNLSDGEMLLLENVRFDPREEENDLTFAREIASLGELYVNEAFASCHRTHASLVAITEFLPSYAGLLLASEVHVLEHALERPEHPVIAVVSGAKIETKVQLLRSLLPRVDRLLTGGGVANMLLQAEGNPVGASLTEPHMVDEVQNLWETFGDKILRPTDVRVSRREDGEISRTLAVEEVGPGDIIYDIGPETLHRYCNVVADARTCIWNGPLGKVERPEFQEGTRKFATCVQASDVYSIVGGGDTVTALTQMGLHDGFDHVSSGGGAMIALLEGTELPAVEALRA